MTGGPFDWERATEAERREHCLARNRDERAAQGLPPFIEDAGLARLAQMIDPFPAPVPKRRAS